MHGTAAPYLNVPEHPDDPRAELADAIERAGDRVYHCAGAVARRFSQHEAVYSGADKVLERLLALVEELEYVTGAP